MELSAYLLVSALLFAIGVFGAVARRNIISVLMAVELMFNAANLNLVAANRLLYPGATVGQVMAIFSITIAAAEAVVGLALVLAIYRKFDNVFVEKFDLLKG
ncbi:MAG: NADH-quinone oxidoreductase subunit NuoK [Elusimicrobia bacterium]|nr:NADH-quinone oxidoreductase subunit NuoK [Elusimicrobiota bacterium]